MAKRFAIVLAAFLLAAMFSLAFFSMAGNSLTFDELAHIGAGYSYITQQDYRMNPEHPPLIKDLSALPLLPLNLAFPKTDPTWTQENSAPAWWTQFDFGRKLIYESGSCVRSIILSARLPMIFLLLLLAWFVFKWARELGGDKTGILALALFSFSPVLIANGGLVTTDMGAAFGVVFATYFWLKFLKNPKKLNILLAGIAFGLAMLMKFSLILLVPFFGILTIIYPLLYFSKEKAKETLKYILLAITAGLIGFLFVVGPVYQYHIWNYPAPHQVRDTKADLAPNKLTVAKDAIIWMSDKPVLRPFAQYFRGVMMAGQRTVLGNTVYFLGNISASSWWYYFPVIYFLKMPLAFHLLTLLALLGLIVSLRKRESIPNLLKNNFAASSFFLFLAIYLGVAVMGNLNIGIRHLIPTLPFIIILIALGVMRLAEETNSSLLKRILLWVISFSLGWYVAVSVSTFPYYISYYNELAGKTENGYKIAVDSNYDWGQDFYRLNDFIRKNNIDKIYLDYFGGESPEYWLRSKYAKLNPKEIKEAPKGWIAVSANQLMGGIANPVPGFDQQIGYYKWLEKYTPVARAGYSIFIYHID